MITFFFVTSITVVILSLIRNNYKASVWQDMDIEARYLAMSGVEIAYMALIKEIPKSGGGTRRVIDEFKTNKLLVLNNPDVSANALGITGNEGTIQITVKIYDRPTIPGQPSDPLNGGDNIEIISTGTSIRNGTKEHKAIASAAISINDRNKLSYGVTTD